MNGSKLTLLVIAFLGLLAILVTIASIQVITDGRLYRKIPKASRPRKSVVTFFFAYFVAFCIWFPVWSVAPHSTLSHILTGIFTAFTAVIAVRYALGKIGSIVAPFAALVQWALGAYRERSVPRKS